MKRFFKYIHRYIAVDFPSFKYVLPTHLIVKENFCRVLLIACYVALRT